MWLYFAVPFQKNIVLSHYNDYDSTITLCVVVAGVDAGVTAVWEF
jgi:hypothetical protein